MKIDVGNITIMTVTTSVPLVRTSVPYPRAAGSTETSVPISGIRPSDKGTETSVPLNMPRPSGILTSVPQSSLRSADTSVPLRAPASTGVDTSVPNRVTTSVPVSVWIEDPMKLVRIRLEAREGRLFIFLDGAKLG